MKLPVYLAMAFGIALAGDARADAVSGDRHVEVNVRFPDSLLMQNGGPVIDLKRPPQEGMHAAIGDGKTDDTAAFQDVYDLLKQKYLRHGCFTTENNFYVYIPDGTYLVTDTIFYRGAPALWKNMEICKVKFIGQSRARTVLKLADHSAAFQDPNQPKPVLSYQHPNTKFNNGPAGNELQNITIDVGKGNPGAVGVMFQGANQTDIRNVSILSEDGAGRYGLWFKVGSVQGYYADVCIEGFDYGIDDVVNPEGDVAFEHLSLVGQNTAGIELDGGGLSLRELDSDQSAHHVPALKIDQAGAQAVIVDSSLHGGSAAQPAILLTKNERQCLFARHVATDGYGPAVQVARETLVPGPAISEYVTSPVKTLFDDANKNSLNLPVQETPVVAWGDPATDWAVVDDFGSVQDALNSGKPVIVFKKRTYQLSGDVSVPSSVRRIDLLGAQLKGGVLRVDHEANDPLLIEEGVVPVRIEAQRNVIERCVSQNVSNPKGLPVTLYLENCNDCVSGPQFCPVGSKVFARQIDVEYANVPQIVCHGGALWVFGFKTEDKKASQPFVVTDGGSLEVLGGYVNMLSGDHPAPLITNDGSNASVTCFTNMAGLYPIAIQETQNGQTAKATNTDFPLRGGGYSKNYVIPFYVSGKSP